MLSSLVATNVEGGLHVHLLHDGSLLAGDIDALRTIVSGAGGVLTARSGLDVRSSGLPASERFPIRAWYRIMLPAVLEELDRVLYIDADALIVGPLDELWRTELGSCLVGAVTNPLYAEMVPRIRTELGLPDASRYFNSGMLLLNLSAWRSANVTEQLVQFVDAHPRLIWPDQDALNGVLHEHRLHLHPRWNAMPGLWELGRRYLPYAWDEREAARRDPAIVHFVGPHKPWHYRSRHPYRSVYFRYLEQTPWHARPIEGRSAWQAVLRRLPARTAYELEVASAEVRRQVASAARMPCARGGRRL